MPTERRKGTKSEPMGPYSAPTPAEAEQEKNQPMAAANDMQTEHDFFVPTSAPLDARAGQPDTSGTPHGRDVEDRDDANLEAESPSGYTEPDARGFRHLKDEPELEDRGD